MKKVSVVGVGLLAVALVVGCTNKKNANDEQVCYNSSEISGIVNGYSVGASDPLSKRVVLLLSRTKVPGGESMKICTGTPISNDVILTAAHCVDGLDKNTMTATFHISSFCDSGYDKTKHDIPVSDYIVKSGYSESVKGKEDVALVKLRSPIPSDYKISAIYDGKSPLSSDKVTLAGYGKKSEYGGGSMVLRTTTKSYKNELVVREKELLLDQRRSGICQGDSGGPVFVEVNGEMQVAGVNSVVFGGSSEYNQCSYYSASMNMSYYKDWVQTQIGNLR